jgi:hypothetical protein
VGVSFKTELKGEPGRSVTGIVVPPEVVEALGSGKRPAVKVTINGSYSYRNTVAVMSGAYMIGVSAEHRAAAGLNAGDPIEVDLELDTEKREVDVPADLDAAIDAAPEARRYFDTLSYSKKLQLVNKMNVKNPDVRKERIEATVAQLLTGKV